MVLGLRTKNKKGASVQVDYLVQVQEIKPWPPSKSLRSLWSVFLQWENGEQNSGSTALALPSLGSGAAGNGKIEFNESFRLLATLSREAPAKGRDAETFQKNYLEFSLYEPRKDKKKLLGIVIIDLAEYGIVKEAVNIGAPLNCKGHFRNTAQPVLFVRIQPFEKDNSSSLSRESLLKESSLDKDGEESISTLMSEEYSEEVEIASFTDDDDVSSHSSFDVPSSAVEAAGGSPPQNVKVHENLNGSSYSSSIDLSSDPGIPENDHASSSNFAGKSLTSIPKKYVTYSAQSSSSSIAYEGTEEVVRPTNDTRNYDNNDSTQEVFYGKSDNGSCRSDEDQQMKDIRPSNDTRNYDHNDSTREVFYGKSGNGSCRSDEDKQMKDITNDLSAMVSSSDTVLKVVEKASFVKSVNSHAKGKDNGHTKGQVDANTGLLTSLMGDVEWEEQGKNGQEDQIKKEKYVMAEDESSDTFLPDFTEKQDACGGDTRSFSRRALGVRGNALSDDKQKHVKSLRSSLDSPMSNGLLIDNKLTSKVKETDALKDVNTGPRSFVTDGGKDAKLASIVKRNSFADDNVQKLQHKIERLEGELREAAAIEIGLYSVVAEHGSSASKVHAPARRISRLYLHALRKCSSARIASAARSAVSGLVLVAKACGNDVPRLTFWLSNSIVLRAVISQAIEESQHPISAGPRVENNRGGKGNNRRSSPLKWKESSSNTREKKFSLSGIFYDWEDPNTFMSVLEKFEGWLFSRIIESVWWQTLTPHMQSTIGNASDKNLTASSRKSYEWRSSLVDQDQGNFSVELWKKAFKDTSERLCPVRAGGHECGCLPVLARLVMEQCVARLDVAMFNAILRESGDEIPTDPVSDPISHSKVLPIPAGKASFVAGAQLKNAIGSWSRWLTDLFGIDDDNGQERETPFKSFNLLYALSDLMMLPKEMLLNSAIRKEVCPTFGAPLIRTVLNNFIPDEFCPDPIPEALFQALEEYSEDVLEAEGQSVRNLPCTAAPIVYFLPSAAFFAGFIGGLGSQSQLRSSWSSVLRKSYTSDDELDELDSPLTSIFDDFRGSPTSTIPSWKQQENGVHNVIRYQLLREVWRDGD